MSARVVMKCELCGTMMAPVLSLGSSPPTCNMRTVGWPSDGEMHYPLELMYCEGCSHGQLSVHVDPEELFPEDYPYQSGNSSELHENFEDLAARFPVGPDDLVVDIGANDGTLLNKFRGRYGCKTVAVEPTDQADKIEGPVHKGFFTETVARAIYVMHGHAKLVTASNVLAHVPDVNDVMAGIAHLLADDGVLVAENHDLGSVVGGQWDTVYHEHLRFFSPTSFYRLLCRHGLEPMGWKEIPTHGGSIRAVASPASPQHAEPIVKDYDFGPVADQAFVARRWLRQTGPFWGVGATARATTIINYCGLDVEDMPCVCEVSGSDKIGRYIPGTRIPVIDESHLFDEQPESVLLLSWHLADRIAPKLRERGFEGNILAPLPALRHV